MIKRIVEISSPARLSYREKQLRVEKEGESPQTVPLEDLGVLILDHPQCRPSQALLNACAESGCIVLISNEKHLPTSLVLPLYGNVLHTRVLRQQIETPVAVKKRLWADVVREKIRGQMRVLQHYGNEVQDFQVFLGRVRSGDPANVEGQAASAYWPKLFGPKFLRDRKAGGVNSLLNYGYAVIRATVARAIVSTGLHPALGIHHSNQFNPLCLADDLMEIYRPLVDWKTFLLASENQTEIDRDTKQELLSLLVHTCVIDKKFLPLMTAVHSYAASVKRVLAKEDQQVVLPEFEIPEVK
jgi:CRISP-associated protein Cas1